MRIRWQTPDGGEGVFQLRAAPLYLVWTEDGFDQVNQLPADVEALQIDPPDDDRKLALAAHGELLLRSSGKTFRRGLIPQGRTIAFLAEGLEGRLQLGEEGGALQGKELGGYKLLGKLGAGAVGIVYRALQKNLDREVALKVLDPELARDAAKVASFHNEAIAAGRLVHPNVVQVYDVGEDGGQHFYSMELMKGGSLETLLNEAPLDWRDALEAVRDCARALAYAEEHNLVHRDVKPDNLMVDDTGAVKLADLGLAATRGMIDREAAGGTPHFMAPEAIGKAPIDGRADLYSLGCTFYRLLTGETPFKGATVRDILRAHRDDPPPSPRAAGADVPGKVEAFLHRLMAKDPAQRPATAAEAVHEADGLLQRGSSRRVAALVVLLLAVGGWAGWQAMQEAPAPAEPEIVERVVTDPEAEARLAEQRVALEFASARATEDPAARILELEATLLRYPDAEQADEARAAIASARDEVAAEAARTAAEAERSGLATMTAAVESDLDAGRYAAALQRIAAEADMPSFERNALRAQVFEAATRRLAVWESEHSAAVASGDLTAAAAVRAKAKRALTEPAAPGTDWAARIGQWEVAAQSAAAAQAAAAEQQLRGGLLRSVQQSAHDALLKFDPDSALARYREAISAVAGTPYEAPMSADRGMFEAAARAAAALRQRLAAGPVPFDHPTEGRRNDWAGFGAAGALFGQQVRGNREERVIPWSDLHDPALVQTLFVAAFDDPAAQADAAAWYLLLVHSHCADLVAQWSGGLPDASGAAAVAAELAGWLAATPFDVAPGSEVEQRLLHPLETFRDFCAAMASGEEYLALMRLEQFSAEWSLLHLWLSDGSGDWGLASE